VVGFLGAGKTTVLRRLVHATVGRRLVYVVNEFSAVDVDAGLIEKEGGAAVAVAGGSIFCRCLVSEFARVLRQVGEGVAGPGGTAFVPEGVVIEASGMADPRSVGRLLAESGLDRSFHVAGVTAVVDPGTLFKLLLVLPNIRGQIETADLILINKCDLHSDKAVEAVRKRLRVINPYAALVQCVYAEVDPEIVLADGVSRRNAEVDAAFGVCRDPSFEREVIPFAWPVDRQALIRAFDGLGDSRDRLYRVKGFVLTEGGWLYLDWSAGRLRVEEPLDVLAAQVSALVLIWDPSVVCKLSLSLRELSKRP
jgi:G3E family GTPase